MCTSPRVCTVRVSWVGFLDALVDWCRKRRATTIVVQVAAPGSVSSLAEYNRTVDLYRGRGFQLDRSGSTLELSLSSSTATRSTPQPTQGK